MRHGFLIVTIIIGLVFVPKSAYAASDISNLCPNTNGQYYRSVLPYVNSRKQQIALVDQYSYKVVQDMADNAPDVTFFRYGAWSSSCRYFAFMLGDDAVIWDTLEQRLMGKFQSIYGGVASVTWSDTDNYLVIGALDGQYLWKLPSNEQIEITRQYGGLDYRWDIPHGHIFSYDGRYILEYDLNSGALIRKFISPFSWSSTEFRVSPDGKTLTIFDRYLALWSVTWDVNADKIIDAQALPVRTQDEVQFSPDKRFLIIYDHGLNVYDTTVAAKLILEPCWPYTYIGVGKQSWRFLDATTLELTDEQNGNQYQYDMIAKKVKSSGWSSITIKQTCNY
jgi:hypothetical protein